MCCEECEAEFEIPDTIFEDYKAEILELFKTEINSEFLDSFTSQAEDRFNRDKWQLHGTTPKEIREYFDSEYCTLDCSEPRKFIKCLKEKLELTINSNQSLTKFVGRIYLTLGIIWLKIVDNEFSLTEIQSNRIYRILQYFIEIDDLVPDTSAAGYLDDLYVSTFAFIHFRTEKKETVIDNLKRELNN
jgi:uncharacterized membrane protein YkvA (DUF1232 family)